jgi:D-beta-D-heptose 7-phosphate kinase/D-beta-D-heptose 1-phosphate adenosyltransferase
VRLDRESRRPPPESTLKRLRDFVATQVSRFDAIVISDYGKGVIHAALLDAVADRVRKRSLICVVDPKKENYHAYRFPTLITPNQREASEASDIAIRDEVSLRSAGAKLVRRWQAEAVLITRGPDGMSLFRRRGGVSHFPTEARDVFEVTGAGDTVVAVCALTLACGASFEDAAVLANMAAGFVGEEMGTVAVPQEKLKRCIQDRT